MNDIKLFSIVMPAYNEQDVIEPTLLELTAHLDEQGFNYEIIVVNDGSSDDTEAVLLKLEQTLPRIRHINSPGPHGYGNAIRKGLQIYQGDAMVIVTSDGSDAPKDVAAYFRKIQEGYDCAFGNRFLPESTVTGYPRIKLIINRIANTFLAVLLRSKYNDYTNGFKCYRRAVIDDMQPILAGQFNITIELAVNAVLAGWKFSVIPNDWAQRDAGESSFKVGRLFKPYGVTLIYCLCRHYIRNSKR